MPAPATPPTDPNALAVLHVLSSISSNPEDVYSALEVDALKRTLAALPVSNL